LPQTLEEEELVEDDDDDEEEEEEIRMENFGKDKQVEIK
jgi:hypothetical protein